MTVLLALGAVLLAAAGLGYAVAPALAWGWVRRRGRAAGVLLPRRPVPAAADVDLLVLDEATVTTGRLQVVGLAPARPGDERNLRWFAGALGHGADDPVSRALARSAPRGRLSAVAPHPGDGMSGTVDRHPVRVGRPAWLGDHEPAGPGTVAVEVDHRLLGRITLAPEPRREAEETLTGLRAAGIEAVLVSTAAELDHLVAALGGVRAEAGLDDTGSRALVVRLRAEGRTVAVAAPAAARPETSAAADLALTEPGDARAITLEDLGVAAAATALALARAARRLAGGLRLTALVLAAVAAVTLVAGLAA